MAAALLAPVLSVAHAQTPTQGEPPLTDPAGDATWFGTRDLWWSATLNCWAGGAAVAKQCQEIAPPPDAGRTPAPAVLDLVHVRFVEEGEALLVELALASVDHELSGLPRDAYAWANYNVCWSVGDVVCRDGVAVTFALINGTIGTDEWYWRVDDACEATGGCSLNVPFEIVPGSPGFLRWHLPRHAMAPDTTVLAQPWAGANFGLYGVGPDALAAGYRAEVQSRQEGAIAATPGTSADVAGPGLDTPLAPLARPFDPARDTVASWEDEVGDPPAPRDDLDILRVEYAESESALTVSTLVAAVSETPEDHDFMMSLAPSTGVVVVGGYTARGGARAEWSGYCGAVCEPYPDAQLRKPAIIDVVAGEPGWINVTFSRGDLGSPRQGDMLAQGYVGLLLPAPAGWQDVGGLNVARAGTTDPWRGDYAWDVPPFWFQQGPPQERVAADLGVRLEDPMDDVNTEATKLLATIDTDAFDITSLYAVGSAPGEVRIELEIRDLSSISIPTGYSAVFYAVAVEVGEGSFMAGYYDDRERKEFFCAPDNAVLASTPSDPTEAIWQPIRGVLSIARDRGTGAGGGSTEGSIAFMVPYSCFGRTEGGDLQAEVLAGATFLIRSVSGQSAGSEIVPLDDVRSEAPVVIHAAQAQRVPFWQDPLGTGSSWDLIAIVASALVALAGAVAILRRRRALKRYLAQMDRIVHEHAKDVPAREAALLDLRARLKRDLLRGSISDAHFLIVEDRLDKLLGATRIATLQTTFDDLPHGLLQSLATLLADGLMEEADFRAFEAQLARSRLTDEAKRDVRERVRLWVKQDAPPV